VVGLYLNPPENAVVLSVDEKTSIQALERTQMPLPLRSGRAGRHTHDYKRHGVVDLYAALEVATCRSPKLDPGEIVGISLVRPVSLELLDRRVLSLLIAMLPQPGRRSELTPRSPWRISPSACNWPSFGVAALARLSTGPIGSSGSRSRVRGPAGATSSSSSNLLPSYVNTARPSAASGSGARAERPDARASIAPPATSSANWLKPTRRGAPRASMASCSSSASESPNGRSRA
jgi:hypothetical protein